MRPASRDFVTPAIIASIIRRPLRPRMSLMTESSLMLASSSVFWIRWIWRLCSRVSCLRGAQQRAQFLDRLFRNEARLDQAAGHQIRDPCRVVDVGLAAGDVLDVGRVRHASVRTRRRSRMFHTGFQ